jgi:hypothetical protein
MKKKLTQKYEYTSRLGTKVFFDVPVLISTSSGSNDVHLDGDSILRFERDVARDWLNDFEAKNR